MINLIIKDILIQKRSFIYAVLIYPLIAIVAFSSNPGGMLGMGIYSIAYIMITGAFAYDEKSNADIFFNSLPVRKKDIVASRYLSLILFIAIGLIIMLFYTKLIPLFKIPIEVGSISIYNIIPITTFIIFLFCAQLPFFYKFGFTKTRTIGIVIYVAIVALIAALSALISESTEIKRFIIYYGSILKYAQIIAIPIFLLISGKLSVKFYSNREF